MIVPTHRRPAQLAECLAALARLDYPSDRYEVIVVDDGGGMPLDEVLEPFRAHMAVTCLAGRRVAAAARNAGAARARGDLLAFTDDDCRPRPDWLRRLARAMRPSPATGSAAAP